MAASTLTLARCGDAGQMDIIMSWTLSNLRREFDWFLKRCLRWSAPVVRRPIGEIAPFLERLSEAELRRYHALTEVYDLSRFAETCTVTELFQSIDRLDLLDQHVGATPPGGLDVGALNWTYLPALTAFKPGPWLGIELDGFQRYVSMDTRGAQARHRASQFPGATYRVQDVHMVEGQWGLVTWFFPYVTPGPLISAGLPDRFFDPVAMLKHVWSLVAPGGTLFVMNVDLNEDGYQRELFDRAGIEVTQLGRIVSVFDDDDDENHGWVAVKPER
ncbi:MAG: hypothetical protein ACPGU1_16695 [Myxococcota bacterium]